MRPMTRSAEQHHRARGDERKSPQRSHRSWSSSVSRSERSSRITRGVRAPPRESERAHGGERAARQRETAAKPNRWALSRSMKRSGDRRKAKSSITISAPRTVRSPGRVALSTNSPTAPTNNATFTIEATTPAARARRRVPRGGWHVGASDAVDECRSHGDNSIR